MAEDNVSYKDNFQRSKMICGSGASNAVYGLGFLGALIYYLQHATTIMDGLLGVLKALVWPAIIVYKWLEFLKM